MNRKAFSISLVAVSALLVSSASALPLNEHALGFHAFLGSDQQFINHTNAGVINTAAAGDKQVLGSPVRNPHAAGNQTVEVSGFNDSVNVTTRCSVSTWTPNGVTVESEPLLRAALRSLECRSQSCRMELDDDGTAEFSQQFTLLVQHTGAVLQRVEFDHVDLGNGKRAHVLYMSADATQTEDGVNSSL